MLAIFCRLESDLLIRILPAGPDADLISPIRIQATALNFYYVDTAVYLQAMKIGAGTSQLSQVKTAAAVDQLQAADPPTAAACSHSSFHIPSTSLKGTASQRICLSTEELRNSDI